MAEHDRSFAECGTDYVVVATPVGRGAIASLFVDGRGGTAKVSRFFRAASGQPLEAVPLKHVVFGCWNEGGNRGEELVVCRRRDDLVEIHCHGGSLPTATIVDSLIGQGCRQLAWQDWIRRTELDPLAAEARIDLASALTPQAAAVLLDQFQGALRRAIQQAIVHLQTGRADQARRCLNELERYADSGMHLVEPWRVVLTGRSNVGKSSLINAMLGYQRSIVFHQPGTTRDIVKAHTAFGGWPVQLADTPGIRTSDDAIESAGVRLARRQIEASDVVILVCDVTQPWSADDDQLVQETSPTLIVYNKSDLAAATDSRPLGLRTSAKTGEGVQHLIDAAASHLTEREPPPCAAVPFRRRHVEIIRQALAMVADGCCVADIVSCLSELTNGPSTSPSE